MPCTCREPKRFRRALFCYSSSSSYVPRVKRLEHVNVCAPSPSDRHTSSLSVLSFTNRQCRSMDSSYCPLGTNCARTPSTQAFLPQLPQASEEWCSSSCKSQVWLEKNGVRTCVVLMMSVALSSPPSVVVVTATRLSNSIVGEPGFASSIANRSPGASLLLCRECEKDGLLCTWGNPPRSVGACSNHSWLKGMKWSCEAWSETQNR